MGLTSKDAVFDVDDPYFASDDFRMFQFKVKRCPRAKPHDWTLCPFAHPGEKAKRRDPLRYRYSGAACPEFRKNGCCRRGDACPFAHGVFECWLHPSRYRTQKCADGPNCGRRVCFFAHEDGELRKAGDDMSYEKPDAPATNGAVGDETLVNHLMSLMKGSSSLASGSSAAVNGGLKPSEPSVFLLAKQKLEKQLQCLQLLEQMQQSAAAGGATQADLINGLASQWLQHGAAGPSAVGPSLQPHLSPDGVQGAEAQASAHLQGAGAIALPGLGLDASMALRGSQMDAVPGGRVAQQMQRQLPNQQQDPMAMYLMSMMQQQQQQQQSVGMPLPQAMDEDAGLQIDARAAKMLQEFMSMQQQQQQQQQQQVPSRSAAAGLTAPPTAADLATTLTTSAGASMPGGAFAAAAWMPQLQQAVQRLGSWQASISSAGKFAGEALDGAAAVPHVSPPQEGSAAAQPGAAAAALLAASAAPPPPQQQRKQQQEQDRTEFLRQLLQRIPELRAVAGLGDGHADALSDASSGAAFRDVASLDARAVGVAPQGRRGAAAPPTSAAESGGAGGSAGGAAGASSGCAAPPPLDPPAATSSSDGSRDCTATASPDRLLKERAGPSAMAALQPPSPSGCRSAEPSPVRTPCEQTATGAVRDGTERPLASSGSLQDVWSWIGEQPSSAKGGEALPSHPRRDAAPPAISLPPAPAPAPELAFPSRLLGSGFAAHQDGMLSPAFAAAAAAAAAARAGEGPGGELAPDLLLSALQSQLQGMTEQEAQGLAQAALVERSQSFDRLLAELPRSISDMIVDGGAAAAATAPAPAGGGTSLPRPHHPPPDGGTD